MVLSFLCIAALSSLLNPVLALQGCPILGPSFPKPQKLSESSIIANAATKLSETIHRTIASSGETSHGVLESNVTSFSIQITSATADRPLFEFHHSAPNLANATSGVHTVDGNTLYRIGSISKLVTVYLFLVEAGDLLWNEPITKYVPEVRALSSSNPEILDSVDWDDVTLGALASHMAGIGRDCRQF
jgi:hypothetical protein